MIFEESYTLHNGVAIPKLALGTWFIDDDKAAEAVRAAVDIGYRHIDTAQAYGNERGVGEGIRTCGIDRKDIFVTSKVAAENKSYASAMESIEKTLETMGLDYLDMMIIHSPQPWVEVNQSEDRYYKENREVWRALEDALGAGKLRAIGVSNFLEGDLENIFAGCRVKPMVNQILCHVGNSPLDLIDYCRKRDIIVEAYSPVAHGEALKDGHLAEMAEKYGVTIPQLCIRYDWQLGTVVLPKTADPEHMKANGDIDFVISDADMELLKNAEPVKDYGSVRKRNTLNSILDVITMFPFIIPGSVLGIAFVFAFNKSPIILTGTALIMIISFAVRRMPYTVRSSTAILGNISPSIEEAAISLGASDMTTFRKITVPMMMPGVLSGAIMSWVTIISELSSSIILYTNSTQTLTVSIYTEVIRGNYGNASAYATILTVTSILSLLLFYKVTGRRDVSV